MSKQKKFLTYIFAIFAFLIVVANIINLLKPKKTQIIKTNLSSTGHDSTSTKVSGITFSGNAPTISETLSIATTQPTQTTHQYIRDQIIKKYSLKKSSDVENFWDNKNYYLHFDSYINKYMFGSTSQIPNNLLSLIDAKATANIFVVNAFPNLKLFPIESDVLYLTSGAASEITTKDNASIIDIPFTYKVSDHPVFIEKNSTYPIRVMINSDLKIQKVVFPSTTLDLKIVDQKNTISAKKALKNINNNIGSIIYSEVDFTNEGDIKNIISGNMDKVQIEYRLDKEINLVYPFYRFYGTIINKDNVPMKAQIITPAIKIVES